MGRRAGAEEFLREVRASAWRCLEERIQSSPVSVAALLGDSEALSKLFGAGATVPEGIYRSPSVLKNRAVLHLLLEARQQNGVGLNQAVRWAAHFGLTEVCDDLLLAGANADVALQSLRGLTTHQGLEDLRLVLKHGADPNVGMKRLLIDGGYIPALEILVDAGGQLSSIDTRFINNARLNDPFMDALRRLYPGDQVYWWADGTWWIGIGLFALSGALLLWEVINYQPLMFFVVLAVDFVLWMCAAPFYSHGRWRWWVKPKKQNTSAA